jgi:IS1 family transposase
LGCCRNQNQREYAGLSGPGLGAKQYYSDAFPIYGTLYYGAPFELRTDKKETYSVEAVNADLRHYLKRLARKSRSFSRKMQALKKNIRLFVFCYNQRQFMERQYPKYSFHLIGFLCMQV